MAVESIAVELTNVVTVFIIGAAVGIFVAKVGRFPYTIALLIAGLFVSVAGVSIGIELSREIIFLLLLPPLLFEGAATIDIEKLRADLVPILLLAVVGLLASVVFLGVVGSYALGIPVLISLLFGSMILPTDPVSVLALFDELGAPERLSVLVEGESLVNDGVGVVVFTTLLSVVVGSEGATARSLLAPGRLSEVAVEIAVSSLGGLVVGLVAGYAVYRVMANLDEHMTEIVLTLILAYGSFLVAEHYLHVSGVIATVAAGILIGNPGAEHAMRPQTKISIFNTWETAAFLVNTLIFILIGAKTPVNQLIEHSSLIAVAVVLVVVARALVVYPLTGVANRFVDNPVPLDYQHLMVWGGLHASIPIALVLGLPADVPFREELRAMVFGVAAFSLVVQGLSMKRLLDSLGVVGRTEAERLYELLIGRAKAVDAALEAASALHESGELPDQVYENFEAEYGREKEDLNRAISALLKQNPEIRREELLVGERRVLKHEKSTIMDGMRRGIINDEVGEKLLDEVDLKLTRVMGGESTVDVEEEEYREFWRREAEEFGIEFEAEGEDDGGDAG